MPSWRMLTVAALTGAAISCSETKPADPPPADKEAEQAEITSNRVRLETSAGPIVIELDPEKAPLSVSNFLRYVGDGHYDGTTFHRVIDGFMIQGGGFSPDADQLVEKPTRDPIPNEARNGLKNRRGTIAMARTNDPDSATSQFFINLKDNTMLDAPNPDGHGYAVFGQVIEGMETVDRIAAVETDYGKLAAIHPQSGELSVSAAADVPKEAVIINSAKPVAE
ncbi:MAG: peptidylprolyl isomerase [Verrucomicrobiota bacterium]